MKACSKWFTLDSILILSKPVVSFLLWFFLSSLYYLNLVVTSDFITFLRPPLSLPNNFLDSLIPWYFFFSHPTFLPRLFISLGLFLCPLLSTSHLLSPREKPQHSHQKQVQSVLASDLKAIIILLATHTSNSRFWSISFPLFLNPINCQASLFFSSKTFLTSSPSFPSFLLSL